MNTNRVACALSVIICLMSAANHELGLVCLTFFFAVWNWYVAGLEHEKEQKNEEKNSNDSGNNDSEDEK